MGYLYLSGVGLKLCLIRKCQQSESGYKTIPPTMNTNTHCDNHSSKSFFVDMMILIRPRISSWYSLSSNCEPRNHVGMTVKGFHTRQNLSVVAAVDEHLQGKKHLEILWVFWWEIEVYFAAQLLGTSNLFQNRKSYSQNTFWRSPRNLTTILIMLPTIFPLGRSF